MKIGWGMLLGAWLLAVPLAHAGVAISGTRVVYPAGDSEVTVALHNENDAPVLVQAWLDNGHDRLEPPERIQVPFVLTPPLLRIEAQGRQSLRLRHTGGSLPQDRESLFWLNVLEIPSKPANAEEVNTLRVLLRTRIKVFFRPAQLPGQAKDAPQQVRWTMTRDNGKHALKADNPTPYHVNLGKVSLSAGSRVLESNAGYVAPFASALFPLPEATTPINDAAVVDYVSIDDAGAEHSGKTPLAGQDSSPRQ